MGHRAPSPQDVHTAAELNAELRELKARSRLTYRQLEERAAQQGELLPRSTLADVLRNGSLPRPDLLAAFIRACGEGDDVDEWLAARQRAAGASASGEEASASGEDAGEQAHGPVRRLLGGRRAGEGGRRTGGGGGPARGPSRRAWVVTGTILAVALLAAASWTLFDSDGPGAAGAARMPGQEVRIRPLKAPRLCVTDGPATGGRYDSLVAVQRPCTEATPPTTFLDAVGENAYRIAWHHPDHGKGCLKALTSGPGKGLLEPWDACAQTTAFRFVPAGPRESADSGRTYRIEVTDRTCVAIARGSTTAGAEAVVEPCADEDAQLFTVERARDAR
jgi:hypothetical protein